MDRYTASVHPGPAHPARPPGSADPVGLPVDPVGPVGPVGLVDPAGRVDLGWAPRRVCPSCRRPQSVCYCEHIPRLHTRTRVVLLQHPRETRMPVGTLRMAKLALPQAEVRVGIDFSADPVLRRLLEQPHPPHLLFPGPGARDVAEMPADEPITLLVVDGTWAQARKLLKSNPQLGQLPQVAFVPRQPSRYQIRAQPAAECVSTIEALAHVLGELESDPLRFQALLDPFNAMVKMQLRFSEEVRAVRRCRPRQRHSGPPPADSAAVLRAHHENLVCVQGEANAWPKNDSNHRPTAEGRAPELIRQAPELIQWYAVRPATGETFSAVIRPQSPLAPDIVNHIELSPTILTQGLEWADFIERWRAFVRPSDHMVVWGRFCFNLARDSGVPMCTGHSDARIAASRYLRRRPGTIELCAQALGVQVPAPPVPGRCAHRLAHLVAVTDHLTAAP